MITRLPKHTTAEIYEAQAAALRELVAALDEWDQQSRTEGNVAPMWRDAVINLPAPGPSFTPDRLRAAWARVLAVTRVKE